MIDFVKAKFVKALKHQKSIGYSIVLPHWFSDCMLMQQIVETTPYQFPDPIILKPDDEQIPLLRSLSSPSKKNPYFQSVLAQAQLNDAVKSGSQADLARSAPLALNTASDMTENQALLGKTILLSSDLRLQESATGSEEVNHSMLSALRSRVEQCGGSLQIAGAETAPAQVLTADIVICKYRQGLVFSRVRALKETQVEIAE